MTTTIYTTGTYFYAVEIGMPTDAIRLGEGATAAQAIAALAPTPMQSAGADTIERDMSVIRSYGCDVSDEIIESLETVAPTQTQTIAIGTDGNRLVIWGAGVDADAAEADALAQDGCETGDQLAYLVVPDTFDVSDIDIERRAGITITERRNSLDIRCDATGDSCTWRH